MKGQGKHLFGSTKGHGEHHLWSWAQIVVVENENQVRNGWTMTQGVLFMLHFEWDFPNVNDT